MADYADGYYLFDHDINAIKRAIEGVGVIAGLNVSGYAAALALSVSTGSAVYESNSLLKSRITASFTSLSITADATYPTKAIVYMNTTTAISVAQGTASSVVPAGQTGKYTREPTPPNPPAGSVLLAEVWIPAGATLGSSCTIFNYNIKPNAGSYVTTD